MPESLREYLWARRAGDNSFVCPSIRGGMLSYHTFQKAIKRICKQAGVTQITPHELRHSASEMWVEEGASQIDIQRLLNHKSLTSTAAYMHRTNERLERLAKNVDRPTLRLISGNQKSVPASDEAAVG